MIDLSLLMTICKVKSRIIDQKLKNTSKLLKLHAFVRIILERVLSSASDFLLDCQDNFGKDTWTWRHHDYQLWSDYIFFKCCQYPPCNSICKLVAQ